jgi:hypothetical protein
LHFGAADILVPLNFFDVLMDAGAEFALDVDGYPDKEI